MAKSLDLKQQQKIKSFEELSSTLDEAREQGLKIVQYQVVGNQEYIKKSSFCKFITRLMK